MAHRIPPRKVTYFEPVVPRLARVSRVGLAALEPLSGERAAEPVDVIAHPPFEATEGQIIPLTTDCCRTRGNPPVADSHLAPHKPVLPTMDCIWGTGQAAPAIVTLERSEASFDRWVPGGR